MSVCNELAKITIVLHCRTKVIFIHLILIDFIFLLGRKDCTVVELELFADADASCLNCFIAVAVEASTVSHDSKHAS